MSRTNLGWRTERTDSIDTTPDQMLPVQFAELLQRSTERTPEQQLMAAVLQDAIRVLCRSPSPTSAEDIFGETAEWFGSCDADWPFAFENVCDALGLDAEWIRGVLGRWLVARALSTRARVKVPFIRRVAGGRLRVARPRVATKRAC